MKFSINREVLLHPLQLVSGVVERRQVQPVLSNLLMVAKESELTLTATDQEVELTVRVSDVNIIDPGETTVPARKLVDICRSMSESAMLTISQESKRLSVSSGRFRSHLVTLPAIDFPNVPTSEIGVQLNIDSMQLLKLLDKTSFAMALQDVRFFFNGVLLDLDGSRIRMVATNGQRLATTQGDLETSHEATQIIIPRKGVNELVRLLNDLRLSGGSGKDDAVLWFSENHLRVVIGQTELITKLIDATYPDYTIAIPRENDKTCLVNRIEVRDALQRTAILSNETYRDVRLSLDELKLFVHTNNPLQEEAEEEVSIDFEGEDLVINFNVDYLLNVLEKIEGEQVKMEFSDEKSPCVLTDPEDSDSIFVVSSMKY